MKIGIDCRIYGPKHTGIGRYVQNLVENLLFIDKDNDYVLFINTDSKDEISNLKLEIENSLKIKNLIIKIVIVDISHYSIREQIELPLIIAKERLDLVHFPHFNVPVFYLGRYVVTIHDLIKHVSRGAETTTRSPWLYCFKYLGYKIVFWLAVKRASRIIVPSQFVKNEMVKEYGVKPGKVVVTYEGVSDSIKKQVLRSKGGNEKVLEKYNIKTPFLLYVGSVYPHKNITRLIKAVKIVNSYQLPVTSDRLLVTSKKKPIADNQPLITLVVVCARNVFSGRLRNKIIQMEAQEFVTLAGFVSDEDLAVLYQEAEAFVFPPLLEGFGLPGLEAMSVGCPVICSDIPVLKEVYKDAAVYFDPLDSKDIAEKIFETMNQEDKREKLIKEGENQVKKYSWEKTAKETLSVYKNVLE